VARGRIELPTPCFSDRGKPLDLSSFYINRYQSALIYKRL
jgi:hypothetical protein